MFVWYCISCVSFGGDIRYQGEGCAGKTEKLKSTFRGRGQKMPIYVMFDEQKLDLSTNLIQ